MQLQVNEAFEKLESSNETGERYVIDLSTLNEASFERCKAPKAKLGPSHPLAMGSIVGGIFKVLCCG